MDFDGVWNERYLICSIGNDIWVYPHFTGGIYDLETRKFIDDDIGLCVSLNDERMYVSFIGSTTKEKGVYCIEYNDNPSKFKLVKIDSLEGYFDVDYDLLCYKWTCVDFADDGNYLLLRKNEMLAEHEYAIFDLRNESITKYDFDEPAEAFLTENKLLVVVMSDYSTCGRYLYYKSIP